MKNVIDVRLFLLLLVVAFFAAATADANAEPYTLNWSNPTQFTDGSPLDPATDIAEIRIFCDGDTTPTYTVTTHPTTSLDIDTTPGDHTCYGIVVDTNGQLSDQSGLITFNVAPRRPNPIIWGTGTAISFPPGGGT